VHHSTLGVIEIAVDVPVIGNEQGSAGGESSTEDFRKFNVQGIYAEV
jgi:hypothetical protein